MNSKVLILGSGELAKRVSQELSELPVEIFLAKDGVTATKLNRDYSFLCVISELKLSSIDEKLKLKLMKGRPTVIITEEADEESWRAAKQYRPVDILEKSYQGEDLYYLIESLLEEDELSHFQESA